MSIEDLLQAILGRKARREGEEGQSTADLLAGLLVGIPGNDQGAPDLSGLLGSLLGRGPGREEAAIVEQAGLPANLIQSALALVAGKLLAGQRGGAGSTASGQIESGVGGAVSLTDLLETMRNQGAVEESRLRASGLPQELAAKTGIDLPQAIRAIQAILALLTGRSSAKSTRKSGAARGAGSQGATKPAGRSRRTKSEEPAAKPAGRSRRTKSEEPAAKPAGRSRRTKTEEPATKPAGRSRRTKSEDKPKEDLDDLLDNWKVTR